RKAWRLAIRLNRTVKSEVGKNPMTPELRRAVESLDAIEASEPPMEVGDLSLDDAQRAAIRIIRRMRGNPTGTLEELRTLWMKPTLLQALWQLQSLEEKLHPSWAGQ